MRSDREPSNLPPSRRARNSEEALLAVRKRHVGEIMTRSLLTVPPATRVGEATWICHDAGIHHLLVASGGILLGVTCLYDLREADHMGEVGACMTTPVVRVGPTATLEEAVELMRKGGIGCLPVVAAERLLGIVTRGDLRRAGLPSEELSKPACVACGSRHHVKLHPRMEDVPMCHLCLDRSLPPLPWEDLGGGD